jgi:hypothetical protein
MLINPMAMKLCRNGGDHIFRLYHAPVKESQAGGHEEYQGGGSKHPGCIARVNALRIPGVEAKGKKGAKQGYYSKGNQGKEPLFFHQKVGLV